MAVIMNALVLLSGMVALATATSEPVRMACDAPCDMYKSGGRYPATKFSSPCAGCWCVRNDQTYPNRCYDLTCETRPCACDEGWEEFHNKCYKFAKCSGCTPLTSKAACGKLGAIQAKITSMEHHRFIVKNKPGRLVSIGAHDMNGVWRWEDGTRVEYFKWHRLEPNRVGKELCMLMGWYSYYRNNDWVDIGCNARVNGYVCEKAKEPMCADKNPECANSGPRFCEDAMSEKYPYLKKYVKENCQMTCKLCGAGAAGCMYMGKNYPIGGSFKLDNEPCTRCYCEKPGQPPRCHVMECFIPICPGGVTPVSDPKACCPVCPMTTVMTCPKPPPMHTSPLLPEMCRERCSNDAGCLPGEKCCYNGCAHQCVPMIFNK